MAAYGVVASVATVISTLLALWQYWKQRSAALSERERIILQKERLRTAVAVAMSGAEAVNLIIQRGKQDDVTITELQSIARTVRGNLVLLTRQLEQEASFLENWQYGQLTSSGGPRQGSANLPQQS